MKQTTLLIMAAGLGSRFGEGIKQLEPVGLHDEIIMDYSIHDAIEAGFDKIIIVIRKDIEKDFRERVGNRVEEVCSKRKVEVILCFQDMHDVPGEVPAERTKPWGTGQAVLTAKEYIREGFCVINADDYYGKEAFREMHDWLVLDHAEHAIAMAGFILKNTLSDHGGVTRGICKVADGHTHIINVIETGNIIKTVDSESGQVGAEADGVKLDMESYVSMNFWGFSAKEGSNPWFLDVLERGFVAFFKDAVPMDPMKAEYLLPTIVGGLLQEGKTTVKVLETTDKWFGVTFKEDKPVVVDSFRKLIQDGVYCEELYADL
ncbi:MAG: nucleotidyltransferase [Clostridiales bacterium]|nr:nucleotidyltransferase [Clostridiales bacterium]